MATTVTVADGIRAAGRLVRRGPLRLLTIYLDSDASDYAAGLAFHALLVSFPLVLGMLSLLGLFVRSDDLAPHVQQAIATSFPEGAQAEVHSALLGLRRNAGVYGLVAVLGLLWSGTGFFARLEFALDRVYMCHHRSFWRQRVMGLGLLGVLAVSVALATAANWAIAFVPRGPALGFLAGWLVVSWLLLLVYRFVPHRRLSLGESWPGALLAGLLIQVMNLAFPTFGHLTRNVNTFGRGFVLFLLLASWLYLVSQLILLGAVLNRLQMGRLPTIGRSHELPGA